MSRLRKLEVNKTEDEFIEFVLDDDSVSSAEPIRADVEPAVPAFIGTLEPSATLDEMPPVFRELALPKLPQLAHTARARLLMQTPNRLFFYWSLGSNPFQRLNRALGAHTASYTLVLRLLDLKRDSEEIHPVEAEGSWWFHVDADGEYRAEIGFYAPNLPFVRAVYSNTVQTPRKNPSTRVATEADWNVTSDEFARVLEVAGFSEDAFDVAIAGDDAESAETTTRDAFSDLVDEDVDTDGISPEDLRHAMLLLAAGHALESLRWKISPALYELMQKYAERLSTERAAAILRERYDIESEEITEEEELGATVYGLSSINFPRRLRTRRKSPKLRPISSPTGSGRN
ncbi:MAG TPA: DUF4912 domain-containing protein [Pyrinomonadaceae bacterium]|nr:DUF4912 domain-containing protein [Pyrinomonadaceae bacterium]